MNFSVLEYARYANINATTAITSVMISKNTTYLPILHKTRSYGGEEKEREGEVEGEGE